MIGDILRKSGIIREATSIKKDSFKYFFIDDIKDLDTITDVEDLGDLKNVEILLTTDKNYVVGKIGDGTWYKIDSEDLIKFMTKTVDKFEAGDYLDFIGSYSLTDLIVNYLETTFQVKHYKDWGDFKGAMEGAGKIKGLEAKDRMMESRYTDMTPKEAAKYAFGVNAFPKDFIDVWTVESGSSRDDAKAEAEIKKLKSDGFEVVRRRFSDFIGWSGAKRKGLEEAASPIDGWDVYRDVYDTYKHGGGRGMMITGRKEYEYYKKLSDLDGFISVTYYSKPGHGSVRFTEKGLKQFFPRGGVSEGVKRYSDVSVKDLDQKERELLKKVRGYPDHKLLQWAGYRSPEDFEDSAETNYSKEALVQSNYDDIKYFVDMRDLVPGEFS